MYSDVFFYLDLTKSFLKMKDIIKSIKDYIVEKNKINVKGHYGILIFQEEGNPIFITDKKDSEIISKAIEENWKNRAKETSYFENGLFYIFSYIAETVRKKSKYNRIIIITDTPSDLSDEYQEALFNIVSKIKHFPTFIDIIRITDESIRFQKDDVKLNVLTSDTQGGIFYIQDKKAFTSIMKKLVKGKQLVSTFADRPDEIKIQSEDYNFYNKLAKKLIKPIKSKNPECYFCHDLVCPLCANINDILQICEDCQNGFHTCCATNYTLTNNIGIPHIFRCPSCDVLLQIDQNLIVGTEDPEITSLDGYFEKEWAPIIIKEQSPDFIELKPSESPLNIKPPSDDDTTQEKIIRVGGFFGKIYNVKKIGGKLVYNRINSPDTKKKQKLTICPQCGATIKSEGIKNCKECGNVLL